MSELDNNESLGHDQLAARSYDIVLLSLYDEVYNTSIHTLSNYLQRKGIVPLSVSILADESGVYTKESYQTLSQLLKKTNAKTIGISVTTDLLNESRNAIQAVREATDSTIIAGGCHATLDPQSTLKAGADIACVGDGEIFLEHYLQGDPIDNLHGAVFRDTTEKTHTNPPVPVKIALDDTSPLAIFDPHSVAILPDGTLKRMSEELAIKFGTYLISQCSYRIMTLRDCPYNCSYCSNKALKAVYGNQRNVVRHLHRTDDSILDELQRVRRDFPACTLIRWGDDDFFRSPMSWFENFMPRYQKQCGLVFSCLASPQTITAEKVRLLMEYGMKDLNIGIQSATEWVRRDLYNRKSQTDASIDQMLDTLAPFAHQMNVSFDFILDNDLYETENELVDGVILVARMGIRLGRHFSISPHSLSLFPNTDLFTRMHRDFPEEAPTYVGRKFIPVNPTFFNRAIVNTPLFPMDLNEVLEYVRASDQISPSKKEQLQAFVAQYGEQYKKAMER